MKNHHLLPTVSQFVIALSKDAIAVIRNERSMGISTCANKAQFQDLSRAVGFVIPLKIKMQYVKYVKYSLNDESRFRFFVF